MNEEHIIAAILTSGLINQDRGNVVSSPADAIELYEVLHCISCEFAPSEKWGQTIKKHA